MLKRWRILLLCVGLALALVAGTWVSAVPAVTTIPTPTPYDFGLTATYLVAGATATAQANATFYALTTPTPTSGIDPIYITATYIVDRATQTEAYYKTATANPIDPIYVTASAVVAQATQIQAAYMTATAGGTFTLPTTFPTAVPTLSDEESTALMKRWTTTLEQTTGFSHPVLDSIAYDFLRQIQFHRQISPFSGFQPDLEIKPVVTRVTFRDNEYVVLVVREPVTWFVTLWIFRLMNDEPILLSGDVPYTLGGGYGELDPAQFTFHDFNQNELPDLVVGYYSGGSCPSMWFGVLEIQTDGSVINVAKAIPGNGPREFGSVEADTNLYGSIIRFETVDVNQDGIPEIKVVGKYFDFPKPPNAGGSCHFLPMTHYYAWDGNEYKDITSTLDESDYPDIDAYFDNLKEPTCLFSDLKLYQVIIDYFVLGRLKEGWARLAPEIHLDLCPPERLAQGGEDIGRFLAWVGTLLELEQQNHSENSS
jgi:hypothetical protein